MDDLKINKNADLNKRKKWSAVFLVICIISIFMGMGINYYTPGKVATVRIVATGEKNAASLGNNVRISLIAADRGTDIEDVCDFNEVTLNGDWKIDEENHLLTCYNVTQKSEVTFQLRDAKNLSIDFVSEMGSGIAEVYINGELAENIDLYSDTEWTSVTKDYDIKYIKTSAFNAAWIMFMVIGALGIVIVVIINRKIISIRIQWLFNCKFHGVNIKRAIYTGILFVFVYITIFTVFQNVVYDNVYEEEAKLTITATGEKSKRALSTNVRVIDIYVNGAEYDLSQAELKNGWEYGLYDSINYMIFNYNANEPASVDIYLNNVRTIDIKFAEEVGSGIVDISLNDRKIDSVDLYKNVKWDYETKYYEVSTIIRPYESYFVFLILFILGFILDVVLDKKESKGKKIFDFIEFAAYNLILTMILYCIVAFMQRESITSVFLWITENTEYFVDGFCILFFINIILSMITGKNYISFTILSVVSVIFLTVNYFKLQFRNMPFLPWDFLQAKVAATVIDKFKLTVPIAIIIGILLIAAVFIFLYVKRKKEPNTPGIITRIVVLCSVACLFCFFMVNFLFNVTVNLFDAKNFYLERGFVGAFFENMQYLKPIEAPENYSEETMQGILNEINSQFTEDSDGNKPNIIVLMSESFWDITRVKELNFGEEIFPTYKKLKDTSVTGELLTNVYGGGTVNSEFEALTGFSVAYLPNEYMPYQRCMRQNFFSVNSFLKSKGYDSLAIHPFEKTNYNRNTAYEYFEFDKTLWEEDFDEDADRMRGYISDHALTEKIISEYEKHRQESNSPWFNLSVSMQNHGAYWDILIDEGKNLDIDVSAFDEETQGSIKDLAIGLHYADLALGELIDYFKTVDEPTVIIMFGDHMTNAGPIGETLLDQSSLLGENYNLSAAGKGVQGKTEHGILEQRRVPFMAWSNYESVQKDCGIISVTQLLPTVFSEYDIAMPKYFEYLKNSQEIYPACASNIFIDKEGNCKFVSDMNEEEKKQYDENWLIEYDYIFGENYLGDLFDY